MNGDDMSQDKQMTSQQWLRMKEKQLNEPRNIWEG